MRRHAAQCDDFMSEMTRQEWRHIFWLEEPGLRLHVQRSMFE